MLNLNEHIQTHLMTLYLSSEDCSKKLFTKIFDIKKDNSQLLLILIKI